MDIEQIDENYVDRMRDHILWRENVGEMYTLLRERELQHSSMTFEWLPNNYAVIGNRPDEETKPQVFVIQPEKSGTPVWSAETPADVNRAKTFGDVISAICTDGSVVLYDWKSEKDPLSYNIHTTNGFGLAWSSEGQLASAADDGTLVVSKVDVEGWKIESKQIKIESGINDVQWATSDTLVAACEDGKLRVFDLSLTLQKEWVATEEPDGPINCVAVNPLCPSMVAVSGNDNLISLWDVREPAEPLAVISGHDKQICCIKFSPNVDGLLATSSADSRVILWDISKFGANQEAEDAEEAAPELVFIHNGHLMEVNEVSWHPTRPWVLGSTAENSTVQIWTPNELTTGVKAERPALPESLL